MLCLMIEFVLFPPRLATIHRYPPQCYMLQSRTVNLPRSWEGVLLFECANGPIFVSLIVISMGSYRRIALHNKNRWEIQGWTSDFRTTIVSTTLVTRSNNRNSKNMMVGLYFPIRIIKGHALVPYFFHLYWQAVFNKAILQISNGDDNNMDQPFPCLIVKQIEQTRLS